MKVKILIIRFSSIGDIVLTTPVIRCLKLQVEGDVEIHYLTKKSYKSILEHHPYIDQLHCIDKSTNEVIEHLKSEQFDYIIDLHKNLRSSRVKSKLPGLAFSFDKLNWQKWLLVNFKINKLPKIHIVDRYLQTVKFLDVKNDGKGLDYYLPPDLSKPNFLSNINLNEVHVFVLGANHYTKRVPEVKISEYLHSQKRTVLLIGGQEDQALGQRLENDHKNVINCAGKTSIHESALIIKEAKLIITPDTGMMHIAAAFKKEIISIWGNTVPDFGMYPYLPKDKNQFQTIENTNLSCRPCSKIGFNKCPKGHFKCMNELDLTQL